MPIELVHVGFDNFVTINRIVSIVSPNSVTIKRAIGEARNNGLLIDMTHGRKTRSAILADSGHIFLTSRAPEIIAGRLRGSQTDGYSGRGDTLLKAETSDEKGEL